MLVVFLLSKDYGRNCSRDEYGENQTLHHSSPRLLLSLTYGEPGILLDPITPEPVSK
jgi:hypothetical protein